MTARSVACCSAFAARHRPRSARCRRSPGPPARRPGWAAEWWLSLPSRPGSRRWTRGSGRSSTAWCSGRSTAWSSASRPAAASRQRTRGSPAPGREPELSAVGVELGKQLTLGDVLPGGHVDMQQLSAALEVDVRLRDRHEIAAPGHAGLHHASLDGDQPLARCRGARGPHDEDRGDQGGRAQQRQEVPERPRCAARLGRGGVGESRRRESSAGQPRSSENAAPEPTHDLIARRWSTHPSLQRTRSS